jgi:putative ABC transport system permease protein
MTVGLVRGEAAGDLRTLTASGATSWTRRSLTAATAAALAVLGVIVGTTGACLTLAAVHFGDLSSLGRPPVLHLLVLAVGTPVLAALAGGLLAGREPSSLAQQPMV